MTTTSAHSPCALVPRKDAQCDGVPGRFCSSFLLPFLTGEHIEEEVGPQETEITNIRDITWSFVLKRERAASSQGPLKHFVPPAPLCSPGLLWVVEGWGVHLTHVLILGREPGFQ